MFNKWLWPRQSSNAEIQDQMKTVLGTPLPMNEEEFECWASCIIADADIPATVESQMKSLASMLEHVAGMASEKEDAYFIEGLRRGAIRANAIEMSRRLNKKEDGPVACS